MFPFSRPPLNPPPLAILKVICLFAVQPVCGADQKMVYGVAHGEIASINCTVKANPTAGIRFRWTFNSSAELNTLPQSRYTVSGPTSQVCIILLSGLYFFFSKVTQWAKIWEKCALFYYWNAALFASKARINVFWFFFKTMILAASEVIVQFTLLL